MILQTITLDEKTIKSRWKEPYVTSGLNQKALAGDARGVVLGFRVVPNVGYTVRVAADPVLGLSIANVVDTSSDKVSITIVQSGDLILDLAAYAGTTVFLAIDAQYAVGADSGAQLLVIDSAELSLNPDLILLAKAVVPVSPPVLTTHLNMGYRLSSGDSIPPDALQPLNALSNGSFERDTAGGAPSSWETLSGSSLSPAVDNSVARTGAQSLRLSSGGAVTGSFATNFVAVEPGQLARASLWIRSTGGAPIVGTGVNAAVVWFDPTYAQLSTSQLESTFTGGSTIFEQRQAEVTAPAGAAFAKIAINYVSCSGTLYVDDVQFIVRSSDVLAKSAVFGGNNSIADQYHSHAATGLGYAGSLPSTWADGTNLPASTVEAALDGIVTAVGGTSGATKVGYTPTTPVDLTGVTRVDQALDILDDEKASLHLTNTFTKTNTFTPSVANSTGIVVNANGSGAGISAIANPTGSGPAIAVTAATSGSGSGLVAVVGSGSTGAAILAASAGANNAVDAESIGTGFAVRGQSISGVGVRGVALLSTNPGVQGQGFTSGAGVQGTGGASGPGVSGQGGASGPGGIFTGGASWHGLQAFGGNTLAASVGVYGTGGTNNGIGVRGDGHGNNYGVWGNGGSSSGPGVHGDGGAPNGQGVSGQGTGSGVGVFGKGGTSGVGVDGQGGDGSNKPGVAGIGGTANGHGVLGTGQGSGNGVVGLGNGAADPGALGVGVYGKGTAGGIFFSNSSGAGADGVQATAGTDGNGVSGSSSNADTVNTNAGVYGVYQGGMQGYGVRGRTVGGGAGVKGESIDIGSPAGWMSNTNSGYGLLTEGGIGVLARGATIAMRSGGFIDFTDSTGLSAPTNPAATDAQYNRLTAKNVIKAWAQIRFDSQTPAAARIIDGFNALSITRSGSTYFLNFVTNIGRPNISSGAGGTFSGPSGVTMTLTTAVTPPFTAADVGRTINISGSTTPANDSPDADSFVITAVPAGNAVQYLNAPGVAEAFPGAWSILETPYAVSFTLSDSPVAIGVAQIVRVSETSTSRVGFVIRDNTGAPRNSGFDPGPGQGLRLTIMVVGPQY